MRATIELTPYLTGTTAKPKFDGWLLTLRVGQGKPTVVKADNDAIAKRALDKAVKEYVQAGYEVECKTHDRKGVLEGYATYILRRGEVQKTEHKVPGRSSSSGSQPEALKAPKKPGRRWTLADARELAIKWGERDPQAAGEFLDGFKAGEWSDADCDRAKKQLGKGGKKATAKKATAKKATAKKATAKKAGAEKLPAVKGEKKKRKPSAYNVFVGKEVKRLVAGGMDNKAAFLQAVEAWNKRK